MTNQSIDFGTSLNTVKAWYLNTVKASLESVCGAGQSGQSGESGQSGQSPGGAGAQSVESVPPVEPGPSL
jgi:hypothetical protein